MKNKGLSIWQRVNSAIEKLSLVECFVIGIVIAVMIVCILAFSGIISFPSATEIYQATYADCMTHENMTKYQCHQIALERVGD